MSKRKQMVERIINPTPVADAVHRILYGKGIPPLFGFSRVKETK